MLACIFISQASKATVVGKDKKKTQCEECGRNVAPLSSLAGFNNRALSFQPSSDTLITNPPERAALCTSADGKDVVFDEEWHPECGCRRRGGLDAGHEFFA